MAKSLNVAPTISSEQRESLLFLMREFSPDILTAHQHEVDARWVLNGRVVSDTFILLPLRGAVMVKSGGRVERVAPGSSAWIPEGIRHAAWPSPECRSILLITVHCHIRTQWGLQLAPLLESPFIRVSPVRYWIGHFRNLVCLMNSDPSLGRRWGGGMMMHFLSEYILGGGLLKIPNEEFDPRIARAIQSMTQRYAGGISVEQLAGEARLSTVQFRKLFRRAVKSGPKAWLLEHRLQTAARLLRTTQLSVKEVSAESGFHENRYFHHRFKRRFQCTPVEYRRCTDF